MPQLSRWFDISDLRTPFLAINLSNRKPSQRETNARLFSREQTGHWAITNAALEHGVEGQQIVLFYSVKGSSKIIYVGTCTSKEQTDTTRNLQPRYTFTVARCWGEVGETTVRFKDFFAGFTMSANPATVWCDFNRYQPPKDEATAIDQDAAHDDDDDSDRDEDGGGGGGYDVPAMTAQRFRHALFVRRVTLFWRRRCALTGLKAPRLVQACHIVPWAESTPVERVDRNNGLLLCAHLHALFDSHLLGFDDDGRLMLSEGIDAGVRALILAGGAVALSKKPTSAQAAFLKRHRATASEAGKRFERVAHR